MKDRGRDKHARKTKAAARGGRGAPAHALAPSPHWPTIRFLPLVLGLGLIVGALGGLGPDDPGVFWSMIGAATVLMAWNAQLLNRPARRVQGLTVAVEIKKQHYMQVFVQMTIFVYWGWHLPFPLVRDHLPMLAVQLAFAYGFDLLLSWTRRGRYTLGFGPFPVIFSINLFLWFKPEWFFLQFVIIAIGFAAKDLIRWNRDGRQVHIFNPSSFPLAIASIALIVTASTGITHGELIANSQAGPPHMYLLLFLVALPGQLVFGVSSMTVSAVLTTYLFGLAYRSVTGTYFFFDCDIPVPVFLGMHLLITDPSTSPKTELGRLAFGAMYGLTTVALYWMLQMGGVASFYDKLLQVPLMNLSVRFLDRAARSPRLAFINPERLGRSLAPRWRNLAYTSIWATTFVILSLVRGVGDRHPGQWWPYWIAACDRGSERACAYVAVVDQQMCGVGSGWACNEAAIYGARSSWGHDAPMSSAQRAEAFDTGCARGFEPACRNAAMAGQAHPTFARSEPALADLPIVLRGSRLWSVPDTTPAALYARACAQGWPGACERAASQVSH